jgi:RHS repeat-associated protein
MLVPNRHGSSNSYRYGFQGQEKDDEIKGEGNSYDFGARMLDPRVGRWFAHDKVNKPWLSPYQFGDNNPTNNIDSDGNDEIHFYYYTIQKLDKDGKSSTELILSSEIIKNNKEHTFYMHVPFGETVQFHPFKSDKTPNDGSEVAYDNEFPLSKGVSFLGFFEKGVDDHAYLGTLLQVAPEILEHYSGSKDGTGVRFQNAINRSGSVDFAETVIRGTETVYAIIDGYYLVKGLSKFAIREYAKSAFKIAKSTNSTIMSTEKTVTILGRLSETRPLAEKLLNVKSGKNVGGVNILSQPNNVWSIETNMKWLQRAIDRGDIIKAASDPTDLKNIYRNGKSGARTVYGEEVKYLESKGYNYNKASSEFIKTKS